MGAMCVWIQATTLVALGTAPATASFTQPSWQYFVDDEAANSMLSRQGDMDVAMAEARIGDASMDGEWEHAIWPHGSVQPQVQGQFNWTNGTAVPFTIDFDATGTIEYTVGGESMKWAGINESFTDIFLRTSATPGASIRITDLELVGSGLDLDDMVSSGDGDIDFLRISNSGAGIRSFTLNGTQVLMWDGAAPADQSLNFQVVLTNVTPEPASLGLLLPAILLLGRRRIR